MAGSGDRFPEPRGGAEARPGVERWVMPFVRDPALWPVLIVVIGHAVAFLAPILLLALRDGRGTAAAALALLVVLSGGVVRSEFRRVGRPAALSVLLLITWSLGVGVAWLANRTGIF